MSDQATCDLLTERLDGSVAAVTSLRDQLEVLIRIGAAVNEMVTRGGTLYTAGNGGSAAQALHLAEELVGRYRGDRRPVPAVCLNADPTALTCIANDYGYEHVFARVCEALLTPGDVLLVLSTSGGSENVVRALQVARKIDVTTVGLLGRTGGACLDLVDHAVLVPFDDSAHVQEAHQVAIHLICEMVEEQLGGRG